MGFFISKLWNRLRGTEEYKIILIGLANAGKTTILYRLQLGSLVAAHPTIGSNVEEVSHKNVRLQMWDLGGQESIRAYWPAYYANTQGIIFVVDSADRSTTLLAKMELFNLLIHPDIKPVPILVLSNKQDLPGALDPGQLSEVLSLVEIREHEWNILPTSALTGEGVYEAVDWITEKLAHN